MGKIVSIKKNKLNFTKISIFMILIVIFLLVVFTSPIFSVKDILIYGNEHYSKEEIINKIDLKLGDNIFLFQKKKIEKALYEDPYIKEANIDIEWPNRIKIKVEERKVVGYVPYVGTYLYIDKDGRVLETSKEYSKNVPIVQGLEFDQFKMGEILPVKNEDSLSVVAVMAQMIIKYNLLQDVIKMDVSDPEDTHLYVKKLDVSMGSVEQFDKKIQWLIQIMNMYDMGKVDLTNINKERAVFSPLT